MSDSNASSTCSRSVPGHLVDGAPWPPRSVERLAATALHLDVGAIERLGAKLARDDVWNCPTIVANDRIIGRRPAGQAQEVKRLLALQTSPFG
jgi:hypothetical protein